LKRKKVEKAPLILRGRDVSLIAHIERKRRGRGSAPAVQFIVKKAETGRDHLLNICRGKALCVYVQFDKEEKKEEINSARPPLGVSCWKEKNTESGLY